MEDLNFSFVMIYIIHKLLVFLNDSIFECFFKEYNRLFLFLIIFFTKYNDGKFKSLRRKHN